mmetsp:Transcript_10425/g.14582  ORF Transcript_10425/g.14582 Transcript_10425/m.14582 type:complete len:250 (-) Transcript_10425:449-1198(-)|eukprot:CAMPEP_0185727402 /NCGR_PEP_ID=MMETSP1171-20130828/3098_1 /TAXON_ID=374046 /ORGANISM="Helicotheca tamensis, Strain CCMP826" /LENGTH=249 /DNA_ID=CAMNT_0028395963 /DNA_START=26 /DNA_END=775 /DNA_ORIENTATION=-
MADKGKVVRRKLAGAGNKSADATTADVESGPVRADTHSYPRSAHGERTGGAKCFDSKICTLLLLMSIFVLFKIDWWYISTPPEIKAAQLKVLDDEIISFVEILKEREEYLQDRLSRVSQQRGQNQEALIDIEVQHGEKVQELEEYAGVGEEVSKLKEEIAKLNKEKAESTKKLQEEIQKSEAELETLHDLIGNLKIDSSLFCDHCPFQQGDLRTTCGQRKQYVMRKHKQTEDETIHAIVQADPRCVKNN